MPVDYAQTSDRPYLVANERHISPDVIDECIAERRIVAIYEDVRPVGWLRFGYLWDAIPIMNMLWIDADRRNKGFGKQLVEFWENEMRKAGHARVMTSSQSDESAQHFYRKLGYHDCGGFVLPGEPLELVFYKDLHPNVPSTR